MHTSNLGVPGNLASTIATMDANDVLYAIESSADYDPGPGLERIRAPLVAINFADDLINPPELGILEREIRRVPEGEAVLIPRSVSATFSLALPDGMEGASPHLGRATSGLGDWRTRAGCPRSPRGDEPGAIRPVGQAFQPDAV